MAKKTGRLISRIFLVKSFVLGLIVLALWARSYFVADVLTVGMGKQSSSITVANGLVVYRAAADGSNEVNFKAMKQWYFADDPAAIVRLLPDRTLGFSYEKRSMFESGRGLAISLTFPVWLLFILVSFKAMRWTFRRSIKNVTETPAHFAWCPKCQCEQAFEADQCAGCGGRLVATQT